MAKQLCDANNARKTGKAICKAIISKLFVQGYNLEVHNVIKYMRKHRAAVTNYCIGGNFRGTKFSRISQVK